MCKFLTLLKRDGDRNEENWHIPITNEEWEKVVKKSKNGNTSSMLFHRTCSVCKCTLHSELVIVIFVKFYDDVVAKGICSHQWLKLLDVTLEKEKG